MLRLKFIDNSTFQEVENLFNENKSFFPIWGTLTNALKACQGHFYVVSYQKDIIGALFLHDWAEKSVYLGGFSKRKNFHTLGAIKLLERATFEDYPVDFIYSQINKENKAAQLCIKKAGFKFLKKENDNYIFYKERFLDV